MNSEARIQNAESSLEAVRALSEGRAPKRFLHTVPVREFRAPVPLIKNTWEMDGVLMRSPAETPRRKVARGTDINDALATFKASAPGEFTTRQATDFLIGAGWRIASDPLMNVSAKLRRLCFAGAVVPVRKERCGKANNTVWRFA